MGVTLLLDTHVLLWALMEPDKLSAPAHGLLENGANTLLVSTLSAWEVATKHRLGRLPEAEAVVHGSSRHLATLRATELPFTVKHVLLAGALPGDHCDPFDRVLAAQALTEGVRLVTADPAFASFGVPQVW